jgi:hypothetical protein
VVLPDGTRCDCVTETHAIEFDFGNKWAEAIGQSAYYSLLTDKKAGIVIILEALKPRLYTLIYQSIPGVSEVLPIVSTNSQQRPL